MVPGTGGQEMKSLKITDLIVVSLFIIGLLVRLYYSLDLRQIYG